MRFFAIIFIFFVVTGCTSHFNGHGMKSKACGKDTYSHDSHGAMAAKDAESKSCMKCGSKMGGSSNCKMKHEDVSDSSHGVHDQGKAGKCGMKKMKQGDTSGSAHDNHAKKKTCECGNKKMKCGGQGESHSHEQHSQEEDLEYLFENE